jgi:tetratricopeptide (TPR) repeat protein
MTGQSPRQPKTVVYPDPVHGPRVVTLHEAAGLLRERLATEADTGEKVKVAAALGGVLEQLEDYVAAQEAYQAGLDLEFDAPAIRYWLENNLGYCLNRMGSFEEGAEHCRRAVGLDPKRSNGHKNLGIALEGLGRLKDAAQCYLRATKVNPGDPRSLHHLDQLTVRHPELARELEGEIASAREAVSSNQSALLDAIRETKRRETRH